MALHRWTWGSGDRVAVLVHGIMSDGRTWWQVAESLADRGYRVIAPDLPGHGHSAPAPTADLAHFADTLVDSVPRWPDLVIAHSMGGFVVAAAADRLRPRRAVFVDTPFAPAPAVPDPGVLAAIYAKGAGRRTLSSLEAAHPDWDPRDREAEAEAAALFDVPTSVSLMVASGGRDHSPIATCPSLVVRPDTSRFVPDQTVPDLRRRGFAVTTISGTSHHVWFGHHEEFMTGIDDFTGLRQRMAA